MATMAAKPTSNLPVMRNVIPGMDSPISTSNSGCRTSGGRAGLGIRFNRRQQPQQIDQRDHSVLDGHQPGQEVHVAVPVDAGYRLNPGGVDRDDVEDPIGQQPNML